MDWERYQQVLVLRGSGKPKEALSQFDKLLETATEPGDKGILYVGIAKCLIELDQLGEAREYVARAYVEVDHRHPFFPFVMLADAYLEDVLGNSKAALTKLESILQKFSDVLADSYYNDLAVAVQGLRGVSLNDLERFAEARPLLEFAVKNNYWKDRTLVDLGICCYRLGDLVHCERYMAEALQEKLSPTYATQAHYYLGTALRWQGKYALARQEFEWCLQNDKSGVIRADYVLNGLVKASEDMGLHEDAKRYSAMLHRQ